MYKKGALNARAHSHTKTLFPTSMEMVWRGGHATSETEKSMHILIILALSVVKAAITKEEKRSDHKGGILETRNEGKKSNRNAMPRRIPQVCQVRYGKTVQRTGFSICFL
jgi:hypothetical protein